MHLHTCACVQDEDDTSSLSELLRTGRGRATVAAELLALMAMSPFLVSPGEQGGGWGRGGRAQRVGGRHCLGSASSNMEPLLTLRADTWRCCSRGGRAHCGS